MTCRGLSVNGSVAVIRLANPSDATNALGRSLLQELEEAIAQLGQEPAVKLLVLTGAGRSFSAGADRSEIDTGSSSEIAALLSTGQSLMRQIMDLDAISLAAINGLTLGGGLELALACDLRWAHVSAVFGLPEAKLGLVPGWGGMSLLRRTVPESLWVEMLAGGECFGARRAHEVGLVSRLFEERNFEAAVMSAARKMADRDAGVMAEVKAFIKRERGKADLSAGDRSFLSLWHERASSTRPSLHAGGSRRVAT